MPIANGPLDGSNNPPSLRICILIQKRGKGIKIARSSAYRSVAWSAQFYGEDMGHEEIRLKIFPILQVTSAAVCKAVSLAVDQFAIQKCDLDLNCPKGSVRGGNLVSRPQSRSSAPKAIFHESVQPQAYKSAAKDFSFDSFVSRKSLAPPFTRHHQAAGNL